MSFAHHHQQQQQNYQAQKNDTQDRLEQERSLMFQAATELLTRNAASSSASLTSSSSDPRTAHNSYSLFPRSSEEKEPMQRTGSTSQMFFSLQNSFDPSQNIWSSSPSSSSSSSSLPASSCSSCLVTTPVYDPPAVDVDQQDLTVDMCMVYVKDIMEVQREKEREQSVPGGFLSLQPEVSEEHRTALVDWIARTCSETRLLNETFFLAVRIVDKVMSTVVVSSAKIQLVGAAGLLIASKFEEEYAISLADLSTAFGGRYTDADVMKMEQSILNILSFEMLLVTPLHFLRRFSRAAGNDQKAHGLAKFFSEISLIDSTLVSLAPSLIAAASVYLARLYTLSSLGVPFPEDSVVLSSKSIALKERQQVVDGSVSVPIPHKVWTQTLRTYCGYECHELASAVARINLLFNIHRPFQARSSYISKKYSQRKLLSVSVMTPLPPSLFRVIF